MLPSPQPSARMTADQTAILKWLRERAPSLAEMYESAVTIMQQPLPARVRLVSHCVRDITNRLPEAVLNSTIKKSEDDGQLIERIVRAWPASDPQLLQTHTPDAPPTVAIPRAAYLAVSALVGARGAGGRRHEEKLRLLFSGGDDSGTSLIGPAVDRFRDLSQWFNRNAHDRLVVDAELCTEEELQSKFKAFERAMFALAGEWVHVQDELDDLLGEANRRTD